MTLRVRRLACCNDPESYACDGVATGRTTLAGQVKGEHPDKERYTGPPGWGLGRWASTSSPDKKKKMGGKKLKNLEIEVDAETKESTRNTEKSWMKGIKKAMNERNLNEGQWEDREQDNIEKRFEPDIYVHTLRIFCSVIADAFCCKTTPDITLCSQNIFFFDFVRRFPYKTYFGKKLY